MSKIWINSDLVQAKCSSAGVITGKCFCNNLINGCLIWLRFSVNSLYKSCIHAIGNLTKAILSNKGDESGFLRNGYTLYKWKMITFDRMLFLVCFNKTTSYWTLSLMLLGTWNSAYQFVVYLLDNIGSTFLQHKSGIQKSRQVLKATIIVTQSVL